LNDSVKNYYIALKGLNNVLLLENCVTDINWLNTQLVMTSFYNLSKQ